MCWPITTEKPYIALSLKEKKENPKMAKHRMCIMLIKRKAMRINQNALRSEGICGRTGVCGPGLWRHMELAPGTVDLAKGQEKLMQYRIIFA